MKLIFIHAFIFLCLGVNAQHNYTQSTCDPGVTAPGSLLVDGNFQFKFTFETRPVTFWLRIFNDNHNEVFTSVTPGDGWNGISQNGDTCNAGTYYWMMTYSYKNGELEKSCTGAVNVYLPEAEKPCEQILYVPNVFGGCGGDSANDMFFPRFDCLPVEFTMWVFDRWGNLVFESHDPYRGWDGRVKEYLVQQDVYVWKIKCNYKKGDPMKEYVGHVTVIR